MAWAGGRAPLQLNDWSKSVVRNICSRPWRWSGVVLVAGHFASLEITGRAFSSLFPSVAALYRSSRNPFVDEILKRLRHKSVPLLIPKQNMRGMVRALRKGIPVWYAPDQELPGRDERAATLLWRAGNDQHRAQRHRTTRQGRRGAARTAPPARWAGLCTRNLSGPG